MDGNHLIDTLAAVIAKCTGRTPERVIMDLSRDVEDPALWKARCDSAQEPQPHRQSRRRWQRVQTRRSRLVVRLCEELAISAPGTVRTDVVLGGYLHYFYQLASAIILHQHGHHCYGDNLARRALQRASCADDATFAVMAADVVTAMQIGITDDRQRERYDAKRRRWRDLDYARRQAEDLLLQCIDRGRHLYDHVRIREIEQTRKRLADTLVDSADPTIKVFAGALEIQVLLVRRLNAQAIVAVDVIEEMHQELPTAYQWVAQWSALARVKAHLALGQYCTVLEQAASLKDTSFHRVTYECEINRLEAIAAMRLGEWDRAKQTITRGMAISSEQLDRLDHQRQIILVAYYNLGADLGHHSTPLPNGRKRISSLMNSLDCVLQDKIGLGPIVLIYEVIAYYLQGKYDIAERRMLNLQVYASRNLRLTGTSALRGFISLLRMIILHRGAFVHDLRRVRYFMSKITDEHEFASEQMICPIPLSTLAQSLLDITRKHR